MPNNKLIQLNEVDRARDVLIDGQTLLSVEPHLLNSYNLSRIKGNLSIHNFIQTSVLFDRVLVDADIFDVSMKWRAIFECFQDMLTPLHVPSRIKWQALSEIQCIPESDYELLDSDSSFFKRNRNNVFGDSMEKHDYYENANSSFYKDSYRPEDRRFEFLSLPAVLRNSSASFFRAHYYLELGKALNVYLSPSPGRANYYRAIKTKFLNSVKNSPQCKLIDHADSIIMKDQNCIIDLDVTIPPVVDLVFRLMKQTGGSLSSAIYRARNSTNARCFRERCSSLINAAEDGRAALSEVQKIKNETEEFCQEWAKDIHEGVNYKTRTLTVSALPTVVTKLLPFDLKIEKKVKDKILHLDNEKRYLLFINDLYRPAKTIYT